MKYSGSATVTLYVMRIKEENGNYRLVQPNDDQELEEELELQVSGHSSFTPGKLSGPFDQCYPNDGQTTISEITLDGKPWLGKLTEAEELKAEEKIDERVCEDEPDVPSYNDYDD